MINLVVSAEALEQDEVRIDGAPYRHLFRARRVERGERVRLVDGQGRARWSIVVRVDRSSAQLQLEEPAPSGEPELLLTVAAGALRPERASWLVEKATEIGVSSILWYRSERSRRTFGAGTLERHERVARAAVEQCGRSRVPEIRGMVQLSELVEEIGEHPSLLLDPGAEVGVAAPPAADRLLLLIGPEGGLSPAERRALEARGVLAWSLGERILRVETAAIVGGALLLLHRSSRA